MVAWWFVFFSLVFVVVEGDGCKRKGRSIAVCDEMKDVETLEDDVTRIRVMKVYGPPSISNIPRELKVLELVKTRNTTCRDFESILDRVVVKLEGEICQVRHN